MKKIISTLLFALVAMTGWAQEKVFKPFVTDSVDFVIEGIVSEGSDSVCLRPRPYKRHEMYPAHNGLEYFLKIGIYVFFRAFARLIF